VIPTAILLDEIVLYNPVYGTEDRYGNATQTDDVGVPLRASVSASAAIEDEEGRETRVSTYTVTVEPTADVQGTSRIEWNDKSLEVVGEPLTHSVRGLSHHKSFEVREIRG
jgi:head-tail adaptor